MKKQSLKIYKNFQHWFTDYPQRTVFQCAVKRLAPTKAADKNRIAEVHRHECSADFRLRINEFLWVDRADCLPLHCRLSRLQFAEICRQISFMQKPRPKEGPGLDDWNYRRIACFGEKVLITGCRRFDELDPANGKAVFPVFIPHCIATFIH